MKHFCHPLLLETTAYETTFSSLGEYITEHVLHGAVGALGIIAQG